MIEPKKLKKGDTIGIIAPSSGLSTIFPHRLNNAVKFLESEGFKVRTFPCTKRIKNSWESSNAKKRAKEIMDAFTDKKIKAIICAIGGSTLNKTLKYLDFDKIKQNPKILCGYSDISVLHYALHKKCNLITYYGPCAITQFGEYPKPIDYTLEYFYKAVIIGKIGRVNPSNKWTDEFLDWGKKKDIIRNRKMKRNKGFEWLRKGKATGKIIGGCLSSIIHLLGTSYWPSHKNKILFIEIPEGENINKSETVDQVDANLCHLENVGIFREIKGLIIGRPMGYSKKEVDLFKEVILENTSDYTFPILYGVDIGHTDPQITVPLGHNVEINSRNNSFEFKN